VLRRLSKADVRTIFLEKRSSHEGLGIGYASSGNGVFVSSVSENSLAARHGVQVGDQILEVCGINMRSAGMYYASNVLGKIPEQDIKLVVQYNPSSFPRALPPAPTALESRRAPPRLVHVRKQQAHWGFTLVGGNATGIFVAGLRAGVCAALSNGDRVLEVWLRNDDV